MGVEEMRKIRIYILGFCLLMSSCNNENQQYLNIGEDGKNSIECSNLDQIVEIPIESSGNWVASLSEDCDWVTILTPEGSNGVLRLVVDINNSSKDHTATKRSTTVDVKCGDQTSAIELIQFVGASASSEPESNSEESILISTKGVGAGFDLMSDRTKSQIFNVNVIDAFKDDKEIRQAFNVFPTASQSIQIHEFDSLESKRDRLGVELSVVVSYGCFALNIKGKYDSYEKKTSANFTYGQVVMLPRQAAKLDVLGLIAKYEENENEKVTGKGTNTKYKKSIEGIFTLGFRNSFQKVKDAHHAKSGEDSREFKKEVAALVARYGGVVITGSTLGGQASMNVQTDTTEVKIESLHIGGIASLAIKALISINGEFEAKYDKAGTEILKNSLIHSFVQGGSSEANTEITNALQSSSNEMSSNKIRDAVAAWEKTVVYNKNGKLNKTEVIEYRFTGIWNLFPYEMAEDVHLAIVELYKKNKAMLDIEKLQLKKAIKK